MTDTRAMRCQWINGPEQPALREILDQYPRLTDADGFIWVFFCNSTIIYEFSFSTISSRCLLLSEIRPKYGTVGVFLHATCLGESYCK